MTFISPQWRKSKYVSDKEQYLEEVERHYYAIIAGTPDFNKSLWDYLKEQGFTTAWLNRHGYYKKNH